MDKKLILIFFLKYTSKTADGILISKETKGECHILHDEEKCQFATLHHKNSSTDKYIQHLRKSHKIEDPEKSQGKLKYIGTEAETKIFNLIVMFIITAGLSLRVVENKYFVELISFAFSLAGVKFDIPCRKKLKR